MTNLQSLDAPYEDTPAPHCFHCQLSDICSLQCFNAMENILREKAGTTAAVIIEPVCQGAAGIRIYPANNRTMDFRESLSLLTK